MVEPIRTARTNRKALALAIATAIAIPAEGLRRTYYLDPPGIVTVCYGTTRNVSKTKVYTIAECKALLDRDMMEAVETVERCVPGLPAPVLAAFSDAVYNIGPKIACNTTKSTAARLLQDGKLELACRQLPRWSRATIAGVSVELPGLVKRRQKEMTLCLEGVQVQPDFLTNTPLGVVSAS